MAILAEFYLLIVYIASSQILLSQGNLWSHDTFLIARGGLIPMRKDCSISLTTCYHTTHTLHHKTASFVRQHCPRKHVCFKPTSSLATMPLSSFLNLSPAEATAKSRTIPVSRLSIATSATSHSTNSSAAVFHNDLALLSKLQGTPIHAPPGLYPLRAGTQSITKTQLQINRVTKEAKAKAAEDKKLVVTTCRTEAQAKKPERQKKLISSAKASCQGGCQSQQTLHQAGQNHHNTCISSWSGGRYPLLP